MDVFDEELLSFWRHLNEAGVKYIMVGGVATNLNGYNRTTDDVDVWIDDTLENRRNFREAFRKYSGLDLFMMERMQIVPGWTPFNLNNGTQLDLMVSMKGLEGVPFDECLAKASIADIDDVKVPFLHINHLIINKKAVNRPKDQLDVLYLEKILILRSEQPGQ
ncbi:MAG: nucleotidyltransferase [Chitinophagaceae bacterium]